MKWLLIVLASFCLTQFDFCIAQSVEAVEEAKSSTDWITFYYKSPSPERFVDELRALTTAGTFEDSKSHAPFIGFLSQVMAQNPESVEPWLKEFEDLDEQPRKLILAAAWYSDTDGAKAYFKEKKLENLAEKDPPDILDLKVDNPSTLDMLWGYFLATGEEAPIRRIVSGLQLSKYAGAAEAFKESQKTEEDKRKVWLYATFQAARWSLTANSKQHPKVLEYCEGIIRDKAIHKEGGKRQLNLSNWLLTNFSAVILEIKEEKGRGG